MSNLNAELKRIWDNYKIYADSCIEAMSIPAPFGVTEEEKEIINKVKDQLRI